MGRRFFVRLILLHDEVSPFGLDVLRQFARVLDLPVVVKLDVVKVRHLDYRIQALFSDPGLLEKCAESRLLGLLGVFRRLVALEFFELFLGWKH